MIPAEGTYVYTQSGVPDYGGWPSVRRATHVGINRARAVAEDGLLYTVETIVPAIKPIAFHARVVVPKEHAARLRDYLKGEYYIGRGRSRGLGSVILSIRREQEDASDLRQRLRRFNLAIQSTLGWYQSQDDLVTVDWPGVLFSVTLHSPAILEAFGCPLAILTPEHLGLPEVHLLQAWARTEIATGWDTAAHLPRRTRLAVQPGSVFLYWAPAEVDQDTLMRQLKKVEIEGIGEERPRGYGQVTVCTPFHYYNRLGDTR